MDMPNDPYPTSVSEILDDEMRFNPSGLRALRAFKSVKPWIGILDERHRKFRKLHEGLCGAYGLVPPPRLIFGNDHASCSGRSCYIPSMKTIVLRGRLSVVTYLHELAHARGMGERGACRWSINIFRRVFPHQFERCRHEGHMLRAVSPIHSSEERP